ncbi:ABC transporter substrate-binding protein [Burkholderia sp. Cy-637]|uniref:ABC transporter substrate-binding protein n=1 Tax=unclassified Burkholderia TaxID=2613784 RepID=UPI0031F3E8AF
MGINRTRWVACLFGAGAMLFGGAALAQSKPTGSMKIAFSNSFASNSWRQQMLQDWDKVSKQAVADKLVAAAPSFTTVQNQATEQSQQIRNLILQGYQAIVIDAASPSAVNGAVRQACSAGIVVVSFDGTVTEPCAYRISIDFKRMGRMELDYFHNRKLKGNLLEVRGLAGFVVDNQIHEGVTDGLKQYPEFKVVGSVNGDYTQTVAQKAVAGLLPTLPEVVAVTTQGGDGAGTARAFLDAGRKLPVIYMGNRYDELALWKSEHDKNGYETQSASIVPGVATFAFWYAQQLLAGNKLPKEVSLPIAVVSQGDLEKSLAATPKGGVYDQTFTRQEVLDYVRQHAAN